jgi:hypothetical protein
MGAMGVGIQGPAVESGERQCHIHPLERTAGYEFRSARHQVRWAEEAEMMQRSSRGVRLGLFDDDVDPDDRLPRNGLASHHEAPLTRPLNGESDLACAARGACYSSSEDVCCLSHRLHLLCPSHFLCRFHSRWDVH